MNENDTIVVNLIRDRMDQSDKHIADKFTDVSKAIKDINETFGGVSSRVTKLETINHIRFGKQQILSCIYGCVGTGFVLLIKGLIL